MSECRKPSYTYKREGDKWRIYNRHGSRNAIFMVEKHARLWVKIINGYLIAPVGDCRYEEIRVDVIDAVFVIMKERGMVV